MPRIPRKLTVRANFSVHMSWRGHNRENNLETDEQKEKYIELLNRELESGKRKAGAYPQAITLMTNHTHEMFFIFVQSLFSDLMRRHHSLYGRFFNDLKDRCGKVAQDRPHTTLAENEYHEMQTVFYIHANPIRAGMVKDARNYRWSTHRLYAFGLRENWMRNIQFPSWYLKLGRTSELRQREYRRLFARFLEENGTFKRHFLRRPFFGNHDWMKERENEIKLWRAEHSPP